MSGGDRLDDLGERLAAFAEELADLALERLRVAADPDDPKAAAAAAEERRITRARRAVEKASALLRAVPEDANE
jgi:hypothetical protein